MWRSANAKLERVIEEDVEAVQSVKTPEKPKRKPWRLSRLFRSKSAAKAGPLSDLPKSGPDAAPDQPVMLVLDVVAESDSHASGSQRAEGGQPKSVRRRNPRQVNRAASAPILPSPPRPERWHLGKQERGRVQTVEVDGSRVTQKPDLHRSSVSVPNPRAFKKQQENRYFVEFEDPTRIAVMPGPNRTTVVTNFGGVRSEVVEKYSSIVSIDGYSMRGYDFETVRTILSNAGIETVVGFKYPARSEGTLLNEMYRRWRKHRKRSKASRLEKKARKRMEQRAAPPNASRNLRRDPHRERSRDHYIRQAKKIVSMKKEKSVKEIASILVELAFLRRENSHLRGVLDDVLDAPYGSPERASGNLSLTNSHSMNCILFPSGDSEPKPPGKLKLFGESCGGNHHGRSCEHSHSHSHHDKSSPPREVSPEFPGALAVPRNLHAVSVSPEPVRAASGFNFLDFEERSVYGEESISLESIATPSAVVALSNIREESLRPPGAAEAWCSPYPSCSTPQPSPQPSPGPGLRRAASIGLAGLAVRIPDKMPAGGPLEEESSSSSFKSKALAADADESLPNVLGGLGKSQSSLLGGLGKSASDLSGLVDNSLGFQIQDSDGMREYFV